MHFKFEQGDRGVKGGRGEPGPKGDLADQPVSIPGDRGENGDKGESGPRGQRGVIGPEGPRGFKGPPGSVGFSPDRVSSFYRSAGQKLERSGAHSSASNEEKFNFRLCINFLKRVFFMKSKGHFKLWEMVKMNLEVRRHLQSKNLHF